MASVQYGTFYNCEGGGRPRTQLERSHQIGPIMRGTGLPSSVLDCDVVGTGLERTEERYGAMGGLTAMHAA